MPLLLPFALKYDEAVGYAHDRASGSTIMNAPVFCLRRKPSSSGYKKFSSISEKIFAKQNPVSSRQFPQVFSLYGFSESEINSRFFAVLEG